MKKSRFTQEQIMFCKKQAKLRMLMPEVCRKLGISNASLYTARKKYDEVSPLSCIRCANSQRKT
ncbi:TPA: transposase [Raoultella planticola]|uniref:transposase n=1 Tax=Raoultella ornithinolytica TaxID=54291 RepID=UPI00374B27D7